MFVVVPYSKKRPNLSTLHQVPVLESTLTMMISFKLHHFPAHWEQTKWTPSFSHIPTSATEPKNNQSRTSLYWKTKIIYCELYFTPSGKKWWWEHHPFVLSIDWYESDLFSFEHGRLEEHKPIVENNIPIHRPTTQPQTAIPESFITITFYLSHANQMSTTLKKSFDTLESANSHKSTPFRPNLSWSLRPEKLPNSSLSQAINTKRSIEMEIGYN